MTVPPEEQASPKTPMNAKGSRTGYTDFKMSADKTDQKLDERNLNHLMQSSLPIANARSPSLLATNQMVR